MFVLVERAMDHFEYLQYNISIPLKVLKDAYKNIVIILILFLINFTTSSKANQMVYTQYISSYRSLSHNVGYMPMESQQSCVGLRQRIELMRGWMLHVCRTHPSYVVTPKVIVTVYILIKVDGMRSLMISQAGEELAVTVPQSMHEG